MANKSIDINPTTAAYVIGGVVAYFGVAKPLLEKLGVLDNADVKANKAAEVNEDAWKPTFWQQGPAGTMIITKAAIDEFLPNLNDAFGVLWDNYDTVFGVFSKLKTKSQISYLADMYQQRYKKGLYQHLQTGGGLLPWDGLSSAHLATINKFVSQLPKYKA